jgi:protein gp37
LESVGWVHQDLAGLQEIPSQREDLSCYMFRIEEDLERDPSVVRRTGKQIFYAPLYWSQPEYILTCSMSDWFHPSADKWRDEAWGIIRQTPEHVYRILTKRPELIREMKNGQLMKDRLPENWDSDYDTVWKHVHLGVTVESQQYAEGYMHPVKGWVEGRMSILRKIPCTLRWVSCEPLLGPVKLNLSGYSWLVSGGESDRDAPRPPAAPGSPSVFLDLQQQAAQAHMPFLFLALGGSKPCHCGCRSRWGCRRLSGTLSQQFPFPTLLAQGQLSKDDKERKIKKAKLLRVLQINGVKKFGDTTQYCINWETYKQTNTELYKILLTETISNSTLNQLQTALPEMSLQLETWPQNGTPATQPPPTPTIIKTTRHKPR